MFSKLIAAATCLAGIAMAQTSSTAQSSTVMIQSSAITDISSAITGATSMLFTSTVTSISPSATSYPVNPGAINETIKVQWCEAQQNSCFQLCDKDPSSNTCDSTTLQYSCQCASGPTPDLAHFNQTIPYFECITYVANCVAATDNAEAQRTCMQTKCGGSVLPINYNSASASGMSATGSMTTAASATSAAASSTSTTSSSGNAASAVQAAEQLGLGVFAIVAAVFSLLL